MNPGVMPYIGLVVAALILLWGVFILGNRYVRRQQLDPKKMDEWIHLTPTSREDLENTLSIRDADEQDAQPQTDLHSKAQQNGHYSKSKKSLN